MAEQGNVDVQVELGDLYLAGEGVPRDDAQAMNWYRKAADHGNARAQIRVGDMYDNAHSVFWDYAQAVAWYRKAAEAGNADGQYKLGLMYDPAMACRRTMSALTCGSTWRPRVGSGMGGFGSRPCGSHDDARSDRRGAATGARVGSEMTADALISALTGSMRRSSVVTGTADVALDWLSL